MRNLKQTVRVVSLTPPGSWRAAEVYDAWLYPEAWQPLKGASTSGWGSTQVLQYTEVVPRRQDLARIRAVRRWRDILNG